MTVLIRRAVSEDSSAIYSLAKQFQTGREPISRDEFDVAFDNVLRKRDQETNILYVAVLDDKVVGYSLMTVSRLLHAPGLTAHLQEIVVDSAVRGQGIGERLIHTNEKYCMGRGVRQLSVSTARMGSFYSHRGFASVGEHFRKILDLSA